MKAKFFVIPAVVALSSTLAFAQSGQTTTQSTTTQSTESRNTSSQAETNRGVPGVDVDVNRSRNDRGLPGVDASIGRDGDQKNIDTRASGAAGSDATMRTARADRN